MAAFNPARPSRVLREWLGDMQVKEAAARLHVSRVTLSRILNGKAGISADMSLRLSDALGTSPTLWIDLQTQYDLWQASRHRRKRVTPLFVGTGRHDTAVESHSSQRAR